MFIVLGADWTSKEFMENIHRSWGHMPNELNCDKILMRSRDVMRNVVRHITHMSGCFALLSCQKQYDRTDIDEIMLWNVTHLNRYDHNDRSGRYR